MFLNKGIAFIAALVLLLCVGQASAASNANNAAATVAQSADADLNGDGMVGFADFLIFAGMFGANQGDDRYDARADLDGDGAIGFGDFLIFANAFGTSGSGGGGSPDLIVIAPSVSDTLLTPGQMFTLNVTVRNHGNAQAAETTLTYYLSTDAAISTSDTEVGTDAVGGLAASGTSDKSIGLNALSSAGMYYYGACVASVSGESNADNNCSGGVRVTVSDGGEGGQGSETSFDLDNNSNPQDILYANDRFYVLDREDARVYGYESDGQRDSGVSFRLNSSSPSSITYANDRFYVVDEEDDKVYGYGSDGQRDAAADFDLGISDPRGITFANERFYVVNDGDEKVYV